MSDSGGTYRHFIPKLDLAVERYTVNVPNDGRYHIVKAGKVIQSFRSMKQAQERFKQLLLESGVKHEPLPIAKANPSDEAIERYALAKQIFRAEGAKFRKKGGRGR
jgi:hypothetical protein